MKNHKNLISILFVVTTIFALSLGVHSTVQAIQVPTLQISPFGLNQDYVTIVGADPNAPVIFYFSTGTTASSANVGVTNSVGYLSVIEDSDIYDLSGGQFYVSVDGGRSPVIYYPSSATPGSFSLSASQITLSVGESSRLTSSMDGSVVSSNTNPSVADVASGLGVVVVNGDNPGTTVVTLCVSNTNCTTLNVTVQSTSAVTIIPAVVSATMASTPSIQCINLPQNLYQGLNDSQTNGKVIVLQSFLARGGYLSVTPNGHFGPATFAALEKFQMTNGIAAVGEAGPATRAAIERLTCNVSLGSSVTATVPTATVTTSSGASIISTTPTVSGASIVTAIQTGATLAVGQTLTLQWNGQSGVAYNLLLEDQYGSGQGFIANNVQGDQYVWTVGNIFTNNSANQTVPPGTYRIHVESAATGVSASDQMSGLFTLAPTQLDINYIVPPSVPADNKTSVVLYGTGFNAATQVLFDPSIATSQSSSPIYVSSDGTVLIFTVPMSISVGEHTIEAVNSFSNSTSTVSVKSNTMDMGVIGTP